MTVIRHIAISRGTRYIKVRYFEIRYIGILGGSRYTMLYNDTLYLPLQPIDYEGFSLLMREYLEAEIPDDLGQHLFCSFIRKPSVDLGMPAGAGRIKMKNFVISLLKGANFFILHLRGAFSKSGEARIIR